MAGRQGATRFDRARAPAPNSLSIIVDIVSVVLYIADVNNL